MFYRKDYFTLPEEFPFDLFITDADSTSEISLHFHDCLEINFVLEGSGFNYIEDKKYTLQRDDLYIINNLERHIAVSSGYLKLLVIIFDPSFIWKSNRLDMEYLKPFFDRNINFSNCIMRSNPLSHHVKEIILELQQEWEIKNEGYRLVIKALLMKLLAILYRHFKNNREIDDEATKFQKSYHRLLPVIDYINENYHKPLTLDELSKLVYMNRTYFSSYFKDVMNINVYDFIKDIRIKTACYLLKTTDQNILDVAEKCGFGNLSSFNKEFKNITGTTPSSYRRKQKQNNV